MPIVSFALLDLLEPLAMRSRVLLRNQTLAHLRPLPSTFMTDDVDCKVSTDNTKFEIALDVNKFSPTDITVRTVDDNVIVVEGKHESQADEHGYIARHFVRRYAIPEGHDAKDVVSSLSADGVLTISAPVRAIQEPAKNERVVPISRTNEETTAGDSSTKNVGGE